MQYGEAVTAESGARRLPSQARSRERFDRVLRAAAAQIGRRGVSAVTMTDIAEEADMALTAVYRYFPNKQSVLRELALRTFALDTETLVDAPSAEGTSVHDALAAGVIEFWRRHHAEPFRLQLRAAIHADPELLALDLAQSRRNAHSIAEFVARRTGRTDRETLERQALLFVELIDSLMRLAHQTPSEEAAALVAEFSRMMAHTLAPDNQPPEHRDNPVRTA